MNNATQQTIATDLYRQCHKWVQEGLLSTEEVPEFYERKWHELIEQQWYGQPEQQPVAAK